MDKYRSTWTRSERSGSADWSDRRAPYRGWTRWTAPEFRRLRSWAAASGPSPRRGWPAAMKWSGGIRKAVPFLYKKKKIKKKKTLVRSNTTRWPNLSGRSNPSQSKGIQSSWEHQPQPFRAGMATGLVLTQDWMIKWLIMRIGAAPDSC